MAQFQGMVPLSQDFQTHLNFDRPTVGPALQRIRRLTFGDDHGDLAKLLLSLMHFRAIQKDDSLIQEVKTLSQKSLTTEDRTRFLAILQLIVKNDDIQLRLLGDVVAGPGPGHDHLTMDAVMRLTQITRVILHLGNHEREWCDMIENDKLLTNRESNPYAFQWETAYKLGDMVRDGVITVQEIKERFAIYRRHFVLLSCSFKEYAHRPPTLTIYCHGPKIDLGSIKRFVLQLDPQFTVAQFHGDGRAVIRAIKVINDALARAPTVSGFIPRDSIPYKWLWDRGYGDFDNAHDLAAYTLKFRHGHDLSQGRSYIDQREGKVLATYKSYDDVTGKGTFTAGPIEVHASLNPMSQSDAVDEADAADSDSFESE